MELTELQAKTAEHIVKVFTRKEAPVKRYLLADEVGLGKTVVTAKVIEELAPQDKPFNVYYICGSLRIISQNADSLKSNIKNAKETPDVRLSMQEGKNESGIYVYSVTPATTFTNAGSHYNEEEALGKYNTQGNDYVSAYFTQYKLLKHLCTSDDFYDKNGLLTEMTAIYGDGLKKLLNGENVIDYNSAIKVTDKCFETVRKYIIQDKILKSLSPDIVILDEFQNYSGLLYDKDREGHGLFIQMLEKAKYTLMLSATPYEMPCGRVKDMNARPYSDGTGLNTQKNDDEEAEDKTPAEGDIKDPDAEFKKLVDFIYGKDTAGIELNEDFLYNNIMCRSERAMFYTDLNKDAEVDELYITPQDAKNHTEYTKRLYDHCKKAAPDWHPVTSADKFIALVKECPSFAKFCTRYVSLKGSGDERKFCQSNNGLFNEKISPEGHSGISLLKRMAYSNDSLSLMLWIPPTLSSAIPKGYQNDDNPFWKNREYSKTLVFGNYRMSTACSAYCFSKAVRDKQQSLPAISGGLEDIDISKYLPYKLKLDGLNEEQLKIYNSNKTYYLNYFDTVEALEKVVRQYLYNYRKVVCHAAGTADLRQAVQIYAEMGGLKSVLEEYCMLLGFKTGAPTNKLKEIKNKLDKMYSYLSGKKVNHTQLYPTTVICYEKGDRHAKSTDELRKRFSYPCGFAERFTDDSTDQGTHRESHQKNLQAMFNSPFYPFIISTTSVAQEGLDFHNYCHQILHWSIPLTPVAYEQREGRIDRYMSHLVRKRLVQKYSGQTSWQGILAEADRDKSTSKPLFPYWYVETDNISRPAKFKRGINVLPNSRESEYFAKLKSALAEYNYYLGPNYQEKPKIDLCPLNKTDNNNNDAAKAP